jgi:hypothetical protein
MDIQYTLNMEKEDKVYWLADSEVEKPYPTSTWYRSAGIEAFVERVEKEHKIVGIVFSGNNIGFVLDKK